MSPLARCLVSALLALAALLASPSASADQYEWVDLPTARAAAARLRVGDVVHLYCAPCGDARSERMTVRSAGIDRIWDAPRSARPYRHGEQSDWALRVNDVHVDLAYVYVRDRARWRNLADLLGLGPSDVPVLLEGQRVGTRWRCGGAMENPYLTRSDARRDPCANGAAVERRTRTEPGWR